MIGASAPVPVRVFISYDVHIIGENANETIASVRGDGLIDVIDDEDDAYG